MTDERNAYPHEMLYDQHVSRPHANENYVTLITLLAVVNATTIRAKSGLTITSPPPWRCGSAQQTAVGSTLAVKQPFEICSIPETWQPLNLAAARAKGHFFASDAGKVLHDHRFYLRADPVTHYDNGISDHAPAGWKQTRSRAVLRPFSSSPPSEQ